MTETETSHYLYPGMLYAKDGQCAITTILGSCISVCLWDGAVKMGGMNHFLLPFWNGEGLPSPKYGNIAIPMLIEKMLSLGCRKENIVAKCFGGGAVLGPSNGMMNVGERNIALARDILREENIPIIGNDTGGNLGRKIIFYTDSGDVFVRRLQKRI